LTVSIGIGFFRKINLENVDIEKKRQEVKENENKIVLMRYKGIGQMYGFGILKTIDENRYQLIYYFSEKITNTTFLYSRLEELIVASH